MPARTEAQSWRLLMGLSLSTKSSMRRPTAPSCPSSVANSGSMRTATCSRCRHFFCTSRLRVWPSSCRTTALPPASMNAWGMNCTRWKSAERASSCTFRRCSWLHCRWSCGACCGSRTVRRPGTKSRFTATCAQASEEQHRARVPQSSIRNSMSSCTLVRATAAGVTPCLLPVAALPCSAMLPPALLTDSAMRPDSWSALRCCSETAWLRSNAMSPVLAKRGRFSSRLEMYMRSTIMSFRKILSLWR
mmetsp:Transcript_71250/g.186816  ORF Transcript_71250/g.186816 Transcript_71250/m.186816 type:complete len:247 (-) Transcript_71250:463-1203(-)